MLVGGTSRRFRGRMFGWPPILFESCTLSLQRRIVRVPATLFGLGEAGSILDIGFVTGNKGRVLAVVVPTSIVLRMTRLRRGLILHCGMCDIYMVMGASSRVVVTLTCLFSFGGMRVSSNAAI